jgi:hypothetical protein
VRAESLWFQAAAAQVFEMGLRGTGKEMMHRPGRGLQSRTGCAMLAAEKIKRAGSAVQTRFTQAYL